ncbi:ABC transporter permease subunit [Thiohalomonas denitrificans]|uniref:Phosphate transport system permease protein n=1 Tax=Thiohalomonas denitrificans TaxID=415747 RepID=A0A1G5Q6K6_9GAMM|nr:ABC transporter permease subunit [Thiohalomonas denitrificans]SCZ57248.1 phosphate transport system permease protein [Thiohalomonas denitrificans]
METPSEFPVSLDNSALNARQRWRMIKDRVAHHAVGLGGVGVIIAILLIFFYLLYVVFPLFLPASIAKLNSYPVPGGTGAESLHVALEESATMAVRYTSGGDAVFFDTDSGKVNTTIPLWEGDVRGIAVDSTGSGLVALGLEDGSALVVKHRFNVSYPDDVRTLTPQIEYPYGPEPLRIADDGVLLKQLVLTDTDRRLLLAGAGDDGRVRLAAFDKKSSFISDEVTLKRSAGIIEAAGVAPAFVRVSPNQKRLYVAGEDGTLLHYGVQDPRKPELLETVAMTDNGVELTSLEFLLGGFSLLAGDSEGRLSQWFPVRDEQNRYHLERIRGFEFQEAPITAIEPEERRKGFLASDSEGRLGIYHSTAERTLLLDRVVDSRIRNLALSPRANRLLVEDTRGNTHAWSVDNEHPEVSWSSLWGKVHYEGYAEPRYTWQSSASTNEFEPKFSLMPLAFGTLKAAFYAMLMAVPLAIFGAIYTAYFMAPKMRSVVKPTIEIMEALPTVILGFLAGLWLAPIMEKHLPGIFMLLLIVPLGVLLFAFAWRQLPGAIRRLVPEGWEGLLLMPVVLFLGWLAMALSVPVEIWLFGGNMPQWLTNELGIPFDQRNSLVIGLAMGFAVIPTIFSITEDAIFSVPKHLTFGSLALGATPWQTLTRVVILTASPGIFSAVMIGMGRAVGETMIVLMATGNTPIMDFSIFEGMRTLAANIAVEMPESEVDSTHYRILFLAALVLFLFTFMVNTVAELVRHRLRRKYSSL